MIFLSWLLVNTINMSSINTATLIDTLISSIKANFAKVSVFTLSIFAFVSNSISALAAPEEFKLSGERMQFAKLDGLVSTIAITLQYFAGGIAIIFVIFNGIKIMTSSDSQRAMEEAKSGMFKVFLGCAVVFLAATIVSLFFKATT